MQFLINIDVDDLPRAIDFYTQAFGLAEGRRLWVDGTELLGGPAPIYLLANAPGTQPAASSPQLRNYARHWTPVHLDIVVDNIDVAVERAVEAGAKLEQPVQSNTWGKLAVLADPFGHGFCLLQFIGKGYGEITAPE